MIYVNKEVFVVMSKVVAWPNNAVKIAPWPFERSTFSWKGGVRAIYVPCIPTLSFTANMYNDDDGGGGGDDDTDDDDEVWLIALVWIVSHGNTFI